MKAPNVDVVVIGGGLAGLCCAIHLAKHKFKVVLVEKNNYPKHKVCGEYVSNEVLPYLDYLGFDPFIFGAKAITKFQLTTHNNKSIEAKLPLGGFGISRYKMDYELFLLAQKEGVNVIQDSVVDVQFNNDVFSTTMKVNDVVTSKLVVGAFGKRSNLDIQFKRDFIKKKSPYLGVKVHVKGEFPENKVALHNFKGGYCGVSKIENNHINLCYITSFDAFKVYKDIHHFQEAIVFKNELLKTIFKSSNQVFDHPLTISQISFETKKPVENHMIMCGDSAGMIHPLCGNGMGMAIRSAKLASDVMIEYLNQNIPTREKLESAYIKLWKNNFKLRLSVGHTIAYLFRQDWLAPKLLVLLRRLPFLVPQIIRMTHGKPIKVK